jgi:hypothetical protein
MPDWYEARIDRQIREAAERGDFDDLPGTGKPLPDRGAALDDEWWIRGLAAREDLSAALPPALALRREIEDLPDRIARIRYERGVREHLEDLNARILLARRGPVEGPPVTVNVVDVEVLVTRWREREQGA